MPSNVVMPALSPTMEVGTLSRWRVKEGDVVKPGDAIAEIETDKTTLEVEALEPGVIARLLVAEGAENVPVGQVIAVLADATKPAVAESGAVESEASRNERIPVSPRARRLAAARGIKLSEVRGSGPGGRVVAADLEAVSPKCTGTDPPCRLVELSAMRKSIARHLIEAAAIPHFQLSIDVRVDRLMERRAELNEALAGRGIKVSINDLLIKALALALGQVPDANVQFAGDRLRTFQRVDVSVAVATDGGLITPVLRDAGSKGLEEISAEMNELAARARRGRLDPEEYRGGTVSLSNLGMYGIKEFEAVINPPQALILAAGAAEKRPWVIDDHLGIARIMTVTGSFDHRAIDGAVGAEVLTALKRLIESPCTFVRASA